MSVAADNASDNGYCHWTKTTTMLACQTLLSLMARVNDSHGQHALKAHCLSFSSSLSHMRRRVSWSTIIFAVVALKHNSQ